MTKKGVKKSLKTFQQIGKGTPEPGPRIALDYEEIREPLTPQSFLPLRKDCNCSCHEENGGSVKHITACCRDDGFAGITEDVRQEVNTQGGPKLVRIGGIHAEKWQGALLRIRQNRLPKEFHVTVNGLAGTLHRTGQQPSSFIYHPNERIVRLDMVSDPELEHAVRQWLGDIPLEAA